LPALKWCGTVMGF